MKAIVALLAFAACASAGLVGPPAYYHHHHHAPAIYSAPIVKHVSPLYAVQPPIVVSKALYGPPPVVKVLHEPVVKVLHAPSPVVKVFHAAPPPLVKTVSFGPIAYGLHDHHHDFHHHHHGHFF